MPGPGQNLTAAALAAAPPQVQLPQDGGETPGSRKVTAFLVCHGSFNPVHKHHVEIMVESRKALETAGYNVVAGFLAPTHQSHLARKKKEAVADQHRFEGLRLACAEADDPSGWLRCDPRGVWYGSSEHMIEKLLECEFHSEFPGAIGFSVKGADVASYWRAGDFHTGSEPKSARIFLFIYIYTDRHTDTHTHTDRQTHTKTDRRRNTDA
jgi:hypothetical protein